MKRFVIAAFLLVSISTLLVIGCSKDDNNKSTTLRVRMTDNPLLAEEVNVDIRQVRVKFRDDSTSGWMDLTTYAGVYNLLGLQNGVDTLLAVGVIPTNTVKEIRFILGTDNTIKVGGITYPLVVPSGGESGLKIKVDKRLNGSLDSLLIDFDAALSVKLMVTGEYQLRPVLKLK
ncbi:MAG: DUF4382 domain-containing protein [Bacteroidota bacterium]|nr:DUF4382 domain-containing protein [Bacteroidota bacterium]